MATPLQPFKIENLGIYGIIRESEVDSSLIPDGAVTKAINVHGDRKGAVTLRSGLTIIGAQMSANTTLGLYNALFSNSAYNTLLAVVSDGTNNDIYKSTGGAWTKSLQDDTKDLRTRFCVFADRVIRVNGTDNMKCWAGTGNWETSGNPINPDDMASYDTKYIETFKSKVYTAGKATNPDRLYYSSVISSAGNIDWTPASDYVDISPNDGENISALKRYSLELLVFKPNYIYRFRTSSVDPDPLIKVGTRSQESIVEGKKGLYFHHDSGFYKYTGGYPQEISRPISDFIDAIPLSYYDNVCGWKDDDHIYWTVGDLTVQGTSYTNIVLRYTESAEIWTIYSYAPELVMGSQFNDGTILYQVVGDTLGNVYKFNNGTTDNSTAISYDLETKWYDMGSIATKKTIQEMIGLCEKAQGGMLKYRVDDSLKWNSIGQLKKYLNYYNTDIQFHRVKFRLNGMSKQEAFIFQGLGIIKGINEGVLE